ncbi:MAG TPA: 30S ribosome-binding factor RbfA [Terriglobales bacterium]|nr:30S ribosome-binding factor RbfA [Terriglobales bacterium]
MHEQRGRQHHMERLSEALREEIATIIEGELEDPRIGLATVSEVQLAPDGRSAQVFVAVSGNEDEGQRTLEGLDAARNYVRREIADRLRLRAAPELHFRLDKSEQYEARIDELLKRIRAKKKI